MDLNNLLNALEMDSIDDGLEYFEQFSALIEYQEELEPNVFSDILIRADNHLLADFIMSYFEDIMTGIPDDSIEIYTLMSSLKRNFINMAKGAGKRKEKINLIDELYRFRQWYLYGSVVHCVDLISGRELDASLCEALLFYRMEKLNEGKYDYDFCDCLDYSVDEYELDEGYDDEACDEYDDEDDYLIDKNNPVIDEISYN